MTREQREQAARTLQEFYDFNKTLTPQGDSWLQADITINRYTQEELGKALPTAIAALRGPQPDPDTGLMKCGYCNGGGEQKPLFHENNYEPHTCMQSYIEISESSYGKKPLICVDLWDGANACAAFEINYCPMCGRKLEGRQ